MHSLRRRLTIVLGAGFAVLILGTGVVAARALGARVTEEFDAALVARARAFLAVTEQERRGIEFDYVPEYMPEFERAERPDYFQIWLDDGSVLFRSKGLGRENLPRSPGLSGTPDVRDATLPDGRPGRLVQIAYVPRAPKEAGVDEGVTDPATLDPKSGKRALVLVVAQSRQRLDDLTGAILGLTLGVGALATLVAALFVWRALAAGFRPVDSIATQVEQLDVDRLQTRVSLPNAPRELEPVVRQLNGLLDRLARSFERERRFTGNVAHELRTPIAELRSLASVGAKWPDDSASVARFFDDVDDVAGKMEGLVTDLLLLARCRAGVERVSTAPTSLREVVASTWEPLTARASDAGLRFRVDVPDDLVVESDPGKLSIVLANVLGNAVAYARRGSEVRCVGARVGPRFRLDVENAAEPLSPEDLERLTEPFWRKDESRTPSDHAGLGLALVSALATLLCLDVGFHQDPEGTFRVRLEGPALGEGRSVARTPALA